MNTHARILNYLIFRHNYKTYLEIGLDNPAATYVDIMAENKESCDPYINVEITPIISKYLTYHMKSDDMFANMEPDKKYDLIFVDGLHDGKQVVRDVINSIKHINNNGLVVVHDCLPKKDYWTEQVFNKDNPKRHLGNGVFDGTWCGTTWTALPVLKKIGVKFETLDVEYGLGVFRCQDVSNIEYNDDMFFDTKYEDVFSNADTLKNTLNIIDEETFLNKY